MSEYDQPSNNLSELAKGYLGNSMSSMPNADIDRIFQKLSPSQQKSFLEELMPMLRYNIGGGQSEGQGYKAIGYGGRIGAEIPVGMDRAGFGVTGSGSKMKNPYGTFANQDITGGDIYYQSGPNRFSAEYNKMAGTPEGVLLKNLLMLKYSRQF